MPRAPRSECEPRACACLPWPAMRGTGCVHLRPRSNRLFQLGKAEGFHHDTHIVEPLDVHLRMKPHEMAGDIVQVMQDCVSARKFKPHRNKIRLSPINSIPTVNSALFFSN